MSLMNRIVFGIHGRLRHWLLGCTLVAIALPGWATDIDQADADWAAGKTASAVIRLKSLLQKQPDDADARLLLGRIYLDSGDPAAADQELTRARAYGATDADTLPPLVEALIAQRRLSDAVELTEIGNEAPPNLRGELLALRGAALLASDNPDEASSLFEQAASADPTAARPLLGMASLALRTGDADRAKELIRTAIELEPESISAWTALGNVEYAARNFEQAIAAYTRAMEHARSRWGLHYQRALARVDSGDIEGAQADLEAVRESNPTFFGLYYLDGRLALLTKDPQKAIDDLDAYLSGVPDDSRATYFAALALLQLGRQEQAEEYLSRLTARYPNNPQPALLLAQTRLNNGDAAGAEDIIRPFTAGTDATPAMFEFLRQSLMAQGRRSEAQELIARAAERFPELVSARLALAQQLQNDGNPTDSVAIIEDVLADQPEHEPANLLLMRAKLLVGDLDGAMALSDAFLEQHPDSAMAHTTRAALLAQAGDIEGAGVAFERAREIDPTSPRSGLGLAALELSNDRPDAARAALQDLLAADPNSAQAELALAALARREGGKAAFEQQLRQALQRNPNNLVLRFALVRHLIGEKQGDAALELLGQATPDPANRMEMLTLQGQAHLAAERPRQAISAFTELAEANPRSAQVRFLLAQLAAANGDPVAAAIHVTKGLSLDRDLELQPRLLMSILKQLPSAAEREGLMQQLLRTEPDHPAVISVDAALLLERREFEPAIAAFERLHRDYPDNLGYLLDLAGALQQAGRAEQAIAVLNAWIDTHPRDIPPRMLLAQMRLTQGELPLAAEQYRKVIAEDDGHAVALNNLAMLSIDDAPRQALALAERAYRQQPEDPAFIDTLGAALLAVGENERARDLLSKAHAGTPDPSIAFRYARALAATGDTDAARRVLLQNQNHSFPEKDEADALLSELTTEN